MNKKDKTKVEANVKYDVLLKANHIYDEFKEFTDGVRCLFMLHRNKEGGQNGSHSDKGVRKVITRDSEEFRLELIKLVDEKERSNIPYRIYSAVNARDIEKAIRQFKFEQLEADYYDTESRYSFYYDSKNRFVGALMTPSSRVKDNQLFMFDVDDIEGRDMMGEALLEFGRINIDIVKQYKTKNGWHILTKPFNPTLFTIPEIGINKDGLLLLSY